MLSKNIPLLQMRSEDHALVKNVHDISKVIFAKCGLTSLVNVFALLLRVIQVGYPQKQDKSAERIRKETVYECIQRRGHLIVSLWNSSDQWVYSAAIHEKASEKDTAHGHLDRPYPLGVCKSNTFHLLILYSQLSHLSI